MELQETHIKEFVTAISTINWNCNYLQLCQILKLNPEDDYSKEKWQQFQQLNQALNYFVIQSLWQLVEAYQQQKQ